MIKCTECGSEFPDGVLFCEQCGAKLPAPVPAGQPAQAAQPGVNAPMVAQPVAPPPVVGVTCTSCGHTNPLGSNFCEECGTPLVAAASAAVPPVQPLQPIQQNNWGVPPVALPKLMLANGTTIVFAPNASGVWLIGREDAVGGIHPDVDLTPHDTEQTVSRKHAQISLVNGHYMLINLTTTNWTKLNGARLASNQPAALKPGDQIEFAKCAFTFGLG